MPLTFGTKKRDVIESNGVYLRNFKKGETKVRFLEEPDEWIAYREHYTRDRKAFPCTDDTQSCPGCTNEDEQVARRSRKYGTHVLLVEPNQVLPFKLSVTLVNRLTARAERNGGTITNRDYVIIKSGEGLSTEYDVDQEEKYTIDVHEQLKKASEGIETILNSMFTENWGDPDDFKPVERDYKDPRPKKEEPKADKPKEDEPPFDDDAVVTEAQLRQMSRAELDKVAEELKIEKYEDLSKGELLKTILDMA